jgi:hypothetical protein
VTLKQDIDAFVAEAAARVPPELMAELERSIEQVRDSGIEERARPCATLHLAER